MSAIDMTEEIDISSIKKLGILGGFFLSLFIIPIFGALMFFVGMVFVLLAFYKFSVIFNKPKLFSKFLQPFVPSIILGFGVLIFEIMFGLGFVFANLYHTGFNEGTFFLLVTIMIFVGVYLVGIFIAYNYKRVFEELSSVTGHRLFATSGKIMFIGSTLVIVFIGIFIVYLSYIMLFISFLTLPDKILLKA
jgi:uncharacterized membrane protein